MRLGSGLSLSREPVSLGAVVTAVVDEIEAASPSARIVLKDGANTVGQWDRAKLSRLVMNLLRNAVQYGDPEQAIQVVLDESDGNARLRIENAGDPIPADVLSQIFEPMTRGDADVQRRGTNLGLGLFICRQIVDAHGGNISVRSDATGTHFLVLLPC
ncbi:hypothetical protein CDN99_24635 [Roseateles aquatilis]|uniref:histidine kinase n=1 Tax=Roseateles aquatilis TaxID=431061 RepID=A0A246IVL6_9BURK|nr:sensor histidine kinase [Roseateles aquatilis]OWQ84077.1 hypothetical protein CDN99_24635 [Roseateles aquatilis]